MTTMRSPHGGDLRCVARRCQPVVDCSADPAAHDRRLAPSLMSGDQQYDPVTRGNGPLQRVIDRRPGAIEVMAMKVERTVRDDVSRAQALVP
jgi:hypothetical protein